MVLSLSSLPLVAALLLFCCLNVEMATSFTATPSSLGVQKHISTLNNLQTSSRLPIKTTTLIPNNKNQYVNNNTVPTTTTTLQMSGGGSNVDGSREGRILLIISCLAVVWGFSIPPEFRRARICTEEQVAAAAKEAHCTTFDNWKSELSQYYKDGGGVKFNFSVEGRGGEEPEQKYLL